MKLTKSLFVAAFFVGAAMFTASDVVAQTCRGPQPSICNRACWGARASSGCGSMSSLTRATVHHTAGSGDYTTSYETGKTKARGVQNYHMDVNGWCDVGYHFLFNAGGHIYEGRVGSMNASSWYSGAHDACNTSSMGFSNMGYYHSPYNQTFTAAQEEANEALIAWRMPTGWSATGSGTYCGASVPTLCGHYQVKATACPGTLIINRLSAMRTDTATKRSCGVVNNSSFVSASGVPGTIGVGKTFTATITFNNNGTKAWTTDATAHNLGSQNPQDNGTWGTGRVGLPFSPVNPGQNAGFTYTFTAPTTPGTYPFEWKTVEDGVGWFGALYATTISVVHFNDASVVSVSAPGSVEAGATFSASVTMKNTGSKTWSAGYNLGSQNPQDNGRWGTGRIPVTGSVGPNVNHTFTYNFTAPTTPGTYAFDWKMVQDGVEWFGPIATGSINVVVNPPAITTQPVAQTKNPGETATFTVSATGTAPLSYQWSKDGVAISGANASSYSKANAQVADAGFYTVVVSNSAGSQTSQAAQLVVTSSGSPVGTGTGIRGSYFDNADLTALTLERTDATVNFDWGTGSPDASIAVDTFSARWVGKVEPRYSQTYTFYTRSDDGARLWVNGTLLIDKWVDQGATEWSGQIALTGGQKYDITMEYFENGGAASAQLSWSSASQAKEVIPQTQLSTPSNNAPTLAAIADRTVNEGTAVTFTASGSDPGDTLTYSLDAGAPSGASINSTSGAFSWTPSESQGPGVYSITVRVTDSGGLSDAKTFSTTVNEVNAAPVLAAIANQTVNEGSTLSLSAAATDSDVPANSISYSLDAGAPSGASINATTGALSWTPTEAQGPGSYPITVRATDNGTPSLSDAKSFTVTVNEVNSAPSLAAIANQTVTEGGTVSLTASATDSDSPAQSISYSLDAGAPAGASINASSGALSWTATEAQSPGNYTITVRATDNGSPALSDAKSFSVTVNEVNNAPVLAAISNLTVNEGSAVAFSASATDSDLAENSVSTISSFESFADGTGSGSVMFRYPSFSSSTTAFLDGSANTSTVTGTFPAGNASTRVLKANWGFAAGAVNPWLRLTTAAPANLPNPTVAFDQALRFDIYVDRDLEIGLGLRETSTTAAIGADGGSAGSIEFVGVPSKNGSAPNPSRVVSAGSWVTLQFNIPSEAVSTFTGNSILESTTAKGVLEHLNFVPAGGSGAYTIYMDNFVMHSRAVQYSLDAGAPAGASIDPFTGAFSWTPSEADGPGTYPITVRVTDNGNLSDTKTFSVTVSEVNNAPTLSAIGNQTVDEGGTVSFTASASDPDAPAQALSYSLDAGAPAGASINATSGAFSWTTTEANGPGNYSVTVRVTDNGSPTQSDSETITITVNEVNTAPGISLGNATVAETFATFDTFDEGYGLDKIMFRKPSNSSTTSAHLDLTPNDNIATATFPAGHSSARVQKVSLSFKTGTTDPWVRFNTFNSLHLPNPTIDLDRTLRFKVYTDKALKIALGVRETATTVEVGANGGTTGTIEFVGAATKIGSTPQPTRTVSAGSWQTLEFNLQSEPAVAFTGNGVLATGKGVLEHLALVPAGGTGAYTIYLDDFEVVYNYSMPSTLTVNSGSKIGFAAGASDADQPAQTLTFSLDAGAPSGASVGSGSGVFDWTPSSAQAGTHNMTVRVTDNGPGSLSAAQAFSVIVNADPFGPQSADSSGLVSADETVTLTWDAEAGKTYNIQFKNNVSDHSWTTLQTVTASSAEESVVVSNEGGERIYRIVLVEGGSAE